MWEIQVTPINTLAIIVCSAILPLSFFFAWFLNKSLLVTVALFVGFISLVAYLASLC